jgi:hypothetical protein
MTLSSFDLARAAPELLGRGEIAEARPGEPVLVRVSDDGAPFPCAVLLQGGQPPALAPGDTVLVWRAPGGADGVVLGRIEPTLPPAESDAGSRPPTLLLEARDELVLRVGDGSITLRKDGKVLIKGKDLVSHAQRLNRIKGGSVSIN